MENYKPILRWIAVAFVGAALLFAYFAPRRSDQAAAPDDSPPQITSTASPLVSAAPTSAPTPVDSPAPASIAVYVCGAIKKTGVFRLAPGSRVVDAVNVAGGLAKDADDEAINLAEPVTDGMKVDVPKKGARRADDYGSLDNASGGAASSSHHSSRHRGSGRSGSHKLQPGQTLNINIASEAELMQLPGVGPGLARRIIEYREANGPFATPDDLQNVSGVGPSKFAKMEGFIRV